MTINNTDRLRHEYEEKGIALMRSGSYVRTSLDRDELERLTTIDFHKIKFRTDPSVVVVRGNGKRGLLARLAYLSKDGEYVKYPDPIFPKRPATFVSVKLLKSEVFKDWKHFLKKIVQQTETRRLCRTTEISNANRRERLGILYETDEHYYSSLVCSADGGCDPFGVGFTLFDVEPTENPLNKENRTTTLTKNPPEAEPVRQSLFALSESTRH